MPSERFLSIYLNDHLAGSTIGYEIAKRAAASNKGTSLGDFLNQLVLDIEQDRAALQALMSDLGIQKDVVKGVAAWTAEKVGRLKFNGQITGYSDLSRLIELEFLRLGVEGKLTLWRTLIQIRENYPPLAHGHLEELASRAEEQRSLLEQAHREAASQAF